MLTSNANIYALLSRLGFPRSYLGKVVLVASVGTQVPLVALVLYLIFGTPVAPAPPLQVLALLLCAVLLGTAVALYALNGLLAPVYLTTQSVRDYLDSKRPPDLPTGFADEVGRLMADVRNALENLDATIRTLEGLSITDPLTGLLNRREVEKRLAEDAARVRRGGTTLTLAVVDVNDFKSINDTHGHQAGDLCIKHVADVIRRNIRQSDWLARWGGDEFIIALHDTSPFAATGLVLQRIVSDLKDNPARLPQGEDLALSITIGASRHSGEADLRELLSKADEAMYEAKREGRPWILSR
ncbi:MAG TPA: GGDEF domain-containing protein [Rubrobacteraceae bacterium]|nr:GGDEF domain-containing protein [Rubrobacteraceae bacterium]